MEEDSNWQFDALHISISSFCEYFVLSCLNIVDDGCLEEGNFQIEALPIDDGVEGSSELIELNGVMPYINYFSSLIP